MAPHRPPLGPQMQKGIESSGSLALRFGAFCRTLQPFACFLVPPKSCRKRKCHAKSCKIMLKPSLWSPYRTSQKGRLADWKGRLADWHWALADWQTVTSLRDTPLVSRGHCGGYPPPIKYVIFSKTSVVGPIMAGSAGIVAAGAIYMCGGEDGDTALCSVERLDLGAPFRWDTRAHW